MNTFVFILVLTFGILLAGNGLPYTNLFSNYNNRDDYYEDYYLRKIPKLKTNPDKVKQISVNHLSWFPMRELEEEPFGKHKQFHHSRSYFVNLQLEEVGEPSESGQNKSLVQNITQKIKGSIKKVKNFTETHHMKSNFSKMKNKSAKSYHKIKNFMKKKHLKEVFSNATHPFRYRGPGKHSSHSKNGTNGCYKYKGPSIRIHPKSSHVEVIKTTTTTPFPYFDTHFSVPRKIKVIIDLKNPERVSKVERNVNNKLFASEEDDKTNSTNVLGAAGEMASDLVGRVTSLWHCVLGSHRVPDTNDVKFYLYTRRNIIIPELLKVNYDLIKKKLKSSTQHPDMDCVDIKPENIGEFVRVSDENREIIKSNFLNLKAPTKVLIHGYTGSYKDSRMAKIKDAYLKSGRFNVIQVDWEMLAAPPYYIRVTHHSKFVGETIAKFLDGLYLAGLNMSLVHLVGFSLGAQVAGFAGNSTFVPVCRITGLDPALPLFLHTEPSGHLDKLDAKFVDVIHTCGGILAMLDPLGHVDFYPNGGMKQPGCEFSNLKCSHSRAPQYFAESVISEKKFTGRLCLNWEEYVAGNCNNNSDISFMGEPCSRRFFLPRFSFNRKLKRKRTNPTQYFPKKHLVLLSRMPPPSITSKVTTPSSKDQEESDCDCDTSKIEQIGKLIKQESHPSFKRETVQFVKTLLGPSLEDAVLKTIEFGKTIIKKSDETEQPHQEQSNESKLLDAIRKEITKHSGKSLDLNLLFQDGKKALKEHKNSSKRRSDRKSVAFDEKMDKNFAFYQKKLAKIRSLDSDLKRDAASPEKIKRQLEALIQINKDEPPEHAVNWNFNYKSPKYPMEMTIMPSICITNENPCQTPSLDSKQECDGDQETSSRQANSKKKCSSKISQAPEFISNALGPTLDVSIIDNLKMMRDIFKCDVGRGEGQKQSAVQVKQEVRLQNSEMEMHCRIEALQKKIEELEHKEHCLVKQIEDEENDREIKRRAFEEERRKLCSAKSCSDKMTQGGWNVCSDKNTMECNLESLQMKIACEEEKLLRLKNQTDCFKREITEAKNKKEAMKRNKSLLDAWDVFASRVCHTRLPSFSRASNLERKQFRRSETGTLHCCFPVLPNQNASESNKCRKKSPCRFGKSDTQCGTKTRCRSSSYTSVHSGGSCCDTSKSCIGEKTAECDPVRNKIKMGDIDFPVQRDITCGLHQMMKSCTCKTPVRREGQLCSSEDDMFRKYKPIQSKYGRNKCKSTHASDKNICQSVSETSLKRNTCPRIVKVMWATTRINVFQDNSRTYEVMDATPKAPHCLPLRTEGIFVVKNSQKRVCPSLSKKHCSPCVSGA